LNYQDSFKPAASGLYRLNEAEEVVRFEENQNMNEFPIAMNTDRAEAILRSVIKYWIAELMECGGTNPEATCEYIFEEEPDLCNLFGEGPVLALCEKLHREEDPGQSAWYTVRFRQLDKLYFDGHLGDYRVRAVYDIGFWWSENGHIDLAGRQIFLPVIMGASPRDMDHMLTEQMVNVVTGATTNDSKWLAEMERLRSMGAPVFKEDLKGKQ
jgi:hypothetical protein